jgi:hypothetical protein
MPNVNTPVVIEIETVVILAVELVPPESPLEETD